MGHAPHFLNLGVVQNLIVGLDEGVGIVAQLRSVQPVADQVVVDGGVKQVIQLLHLGFLDVGDGGEILHLGNRPFFGWDFSSPLDSIIPDARGIVK